MIVFYGFYCCTTTEKGRSRSQAVVGTGRFGHRAKLCKEICSALCICTLLDFYDWEIKTINDVLFPLQERARGFSSVRTWRFCAIPRPVRRHTGAENACCLQDVEQIICMRPLQRELEGRVMTDFVNGNTRLVGHLAERASLVEQVLGRVKLLDLAVGHDEDAVV